MKFSWMQIHYIKMSQYFPELCEPFGAGINVKWKGYDSSFKSLIDKKEAEWNSLEYKSII